MPKRRITRQKTGISVRLPKIWVEQVEEAACSKIVGVSQTLSANSITMTPIFEKDREMTL